MANAALTTAQRIRMKAEAAARAEKEKKNAPQPAKRRAEGPSKAAQPAKTATTTAKKPVGQSQQAKTGSKNTKQPAKGRPVAKKPIPRPDVTVEDLPQAAPWEVVPDEEVLVNGVEAAMAGGVGEVAAGRYINSDYDEETGEFTAGLRKTTTPGVYINAAGIMVDENGIAMSFKKVKEADDDRFEKILGKKLETPAELLKAVSLDPTKPLAMRIDSAKSAAPYFTRKMPIGLDGGGDGKPIMLSIKELRGISMEELLQMEALVTKALASPENQDDAA